MSTIFYMNSYLIYGDVITLRGSNPFGVSNYTDYFQLNLMTLFRVKLVLPAYDRIVPFILTLLQTKFNDEWNYTNVDWRIENSLHL